MKKLPFHKGIHFKLLIAMTGLLLLNATASGLLHLYSLHKASEESLVRQNHLWREFLYRTFESWTHTLKFNVQHNVGRPDFGTSPSRLANLVSNNSDVTHAIVADKNGHVYIFIKKPDVVLAGVPDPGDIAVSSQSSASRSVYTIDQLPHGLVEFTQPLEYEGQHWGVFRLGFSLRYLRELEGLIDQEFRAAQPQMIKHDVVIVSFVLAGSFCVILLLASRLTRPIEQLTEMTGNVARGDFQAVAQMNVTSGDEVGMLGEAFKEMTRQLDHLQKNQSSVVVKALQSEVFLKSILDNIPDMVFLKDAQNLRFSYLNSGGEKLLGFPLKSLLGKTDLDVFPGEQAESFMERDREALRSNHLVEIPEEPVSTRDGSIRFLNTKKIPILDASGQPVHLLGISRDITDIKKARDDQLCFFTKAPDMLCIIGFDDVFQLVNPAFQRLSGFGEQELIGHHLREYVHPDDLGDVEEFMRDLIAGTLPSATHAIRSRHKCGEYRWFKWSANADHDWERFYTVARDITEQIELEKLIVDAGTKEQERIAHDLHDSLGQTLTGLAIKTKLLERYSRDGEVAPLDSVRQIVWLANHTSEQARAIARGMDPVVLEEGLVPALQDLADSTSEGFETACVFYHQPSVEIRDKRIASHLYRIAQEAVTNAVRHGKAKRILIRIYRKDQTVFLSVSDDGDGMPASDVRANGNGAGIRNMQYRARIIGARLEISRNEQSGVTVLCRLRGFDGEPAKQQEEPANKTGMVNT